MRRLITAAVLVLATALVGTAPAHAKDTLCVGELTGFVDNVVVPAGADCTILGAQVRGNVLAGPRSTLGIFGANVGGNLDVKEGASVHMIADTIAGNFACDKCRVNVFASAFAGNVQIKDVREGALFEFSRVGGNLDVVGGSAGASAFLIGATTVGGNFKFEKNAGPTGLIGNTITRSLGVIENTFSGAACPPRPFDLEPICIENGELFNNHVGGHMELAKNVGPSDVSLSVVGQKLQCTGNSPAPTGTRNTARKKEGQCRAL